MYLYTHKLLSGRWCDTVMNVHALSEDRSDNSEDSFCVELEQVLITTVFCSSGYYSVPRELCT
jgi:hypothetical protein